MKEAREKDARDEMIERGENKIDEKFAAFTNRMAEDGVKTDFNSYSEGFNDGSDFALSLDPWVSVDERLPSEAGEYVFRTRVDNVTGAFCQTLMVQDDDPRFVGDWAKQVRQHYSHWMPIPPFAPADKGGEK